ncbi:hypothetical protein, partial [Klebsiella pneumoniae]|uniref:hypothetical protein n=1 Tax=Klebsiella pneumoniae TaxID=573 RepID=UPI00214CAB21
FASLTAAISIEKKGVRESMPDLAVVHHSLNSYERNLTQYFEDFLQPRPDLPQGMEDELERVVRHLVEHRWPFRLHATYDES